jgi:prepilin peptidase CpaA
MLKFFPDPTFGWIFCVVLVGITVVSCYFDLRYFKIPKPLTLTGLALGILFNVVRGAWLGSDEQPVWKLGAGGSFVGAADGLLFALAGFGVAFGLFLVMYLLGQSGGGDVKLFAAVGAWVGPLWTVYLLILTIIFVAVLSVLRFTWTMYRLGPGTTWKQYSARRAPRAPKKGKAAPRDNLVPRRRLMGYSLPVALSTVILLSWECRNEIPTFFPAKADQSRTGSQR